MPRGNHSRKQPSATTLLQGHQFQGKRIRMTGTQIDDDAVDVTRLSPTEIAELGKSVLGHAVRRALSAMDGDEDPLAAFQDSL
jgi:FXSXX-COOH protein